MEHSQIEEREKTLSIKRLFRNKTFISDLWHFNIIIVVTKIKCGLLSKHFFQNTE